MDDCLWIYGKSNNVEDIQNFVNEAVDPMIVTYDVEQNDSMDFLDFSIGRHKGAMTSKVFYKKSDTGIICHSQSFEPKIWKINTLKWYLNRAWSHSSTFQFFHEECKNVVNKFIKQGHNPQLIDKHVFWAINRYMRGEVNNRNKSDQKSKCKFVGIPFMGKESSLDIKQLFPKDRVKVWFKCNSLSGFFRKGNKCNKVERYNVIYSFKCASNISIEYIGMTTRRLKQRIAEHKRPASPVGTHLLSCDECCRHELADLFSILDHSSNKYALSILEAVYIKECKPILNTSNTRQEGPIKLRI